MFILIAEKTSLCFTILLTFLPLLKCSNSPQPFIHVKCSGDTNYTAHSTFYHNLHKILDSLTEHGPTNGFYNNSMGEDDNQVFGLALCRGDISADNCSTCLGMARREVTEKCLMRKTAIIWYDLCFLRYSNKQFLPSQGFEDMECFPNQTGESRPYCSKFPLLCMFMRRLAQDLTSNLSKDMFAAESKPLNWVQDVYGMVQCSRDLSMSDCQRCLQFAINRIANCNYSNGGRLLGSSCNLRFEFYPFFNSNDSTDSPPTDSTPQPAHANGNNRSRNTGSNSLPPEYIFAIVFMAIIATMMLLCIVATCLLMKPKEKETCRVAPEAPPESRNAEPLKFDLDTILAATSNFSEENKLRECSLGHVYQGTLFDGREIEVNRLQWDSSQGIEQLKNEAVWTARLQHNNLFRLLGYCMEGDEKLLVYEYVSNKSLDYFLIDPVRRGQLGWDTRFMIIKGIAQGLLYLHEESPYKIVLRDLKASNIFLDRELCPKIGEFGFTRLSRGDYIAGTRGYMVPENEMREQFSVKSDIFSFGVLAIEIVSGRKRADFTQSQDAPDLLRRTWKQWMEGKVLELMDPTLVESCSISEVLRCIHVALLCVQENPADRPHMSVVNIMLNARNPSTFTNISDPPSKA
ncbi:cysteine-rich receptor-like protein kinase 10 [Cinnamomum micranthum f. kanehirae]|uniref:Cysteine-rich receptor-like protein kinase 10 n=1 Tax=Cinnamomum micranthum f. kanehirae TaxID=337451 RepID=A0A3S3N6U9_9MAGN|nr:cysteine-rich receptor-like protein kinase 10 [Cinnamomum micranthum f. kanehirae]